MDVTRIKGIKLGLYVFLCICLFIIFYFRYLDLRAGSPTRVDLSTHVLIVENLKNLNFFPGWNKSTVGRHSVSKYLPVYHGLIAYHAAAILLEKLGIPLLGAFLLLMDISLIVILWIFYKIFDSSKAPLLNQVLAIGILLGMFLPNFAQGVESGFLGQIFSIALWMLAYWQWKSGRRHLAAAVVLVAILSYPDFLLWLLPVFILSRKNIRWFWRLCFLIIWVLLVLTVYHRIALAGTDVYSIYPLIFLTIANIFFAKDLRKIKPAEAVAVISFNLVCILFLALHINNMNFSYYAFKFSAPAAVFLGAMVLFVPLKNFRGLLFISMLLLFFPSLGGFNWRTIAHYLRHPVINNAYFQRAQNLKRTLDDLTQKGFCKSQDTLFIPNQEALYIPNNDNDKLINRGNSFLIPNALFLNFELYGFSFVNPNLNKMFWSPIGSVSTAIQALEKNQFFAKIEKGHLDAPICFVVPERFQSSIDSLSNVEVVKKTDGILFVRKQPSI